MEFETGTCPGKQASGREVFVVEESGRPGSSVRRFCSGNLLMEPQRGWEKFSQRASDP